jgi:hypothetical protein
MGSVADEDMASLQAVANASGGRYVTAGSAEELKSALAQTVATAFSVFDGNTIVANGSLGSEETFFLPEGEYRVVLHSSPAKEVAVSLAPKDSVNLTFEKQGDDVIHAEHRGRIEYRSCEVAGQAVSRSP